MTIIATIDIGTNSVLLSIFRHSTSADQAPSERVNLIPVLERATVTRLGQEVDQTRSLHPQAIDRTLTCLKEYANLIRQYEPSALAVVGTSALRDANGSDTFLSAAKSVLQQPVEIISGTREATLTFNGSLQGLSLKENAFVFDIGGGSTELIVGNPITREILTSTSLDIGSVRLNERIKPNDPPSQANLESFEAEIQRALSRLPRSSHPKLVGVGVAGTMTTLSALMLKLKQYDPKLVHGTQCSLEMIGAQRDYLQSMSLADRARLPCLSTGRADVIIAGATIAYEVIKWAGLESVFVSDRGVRYGLAMELVSKI